MQHMMERIERAAQAVRAQCGEAEIGLICGSGLGGYTDTMKDTVRMSYRQTPDFPVSSVVGHAGEWCFGTVGGRRVAAMNGRFHYYEGYNQQEVTLPIRVMKKLGVRTLIVTNAAGAVNETFNPGDLMLIRDFINFSGANPLRGANMDAFGPRFPDMSYAMDRSCWYVARKAAEKVGVPLREGVYCMMSGPCFETPAEIRMLRLLGADAVGMSTVPEIIVARHAGMRVLGISCMTNMAAGILEQPLNHQEVLETGEKVQRRFQALMDAVIADI